MTSPETILSRMGVPGYEGIFVIGSGESRITLYSQQVRALNLAWALAEHALLPRGATVGILGAGAAGLTAAIALGRLGAKVDIFDSHEIILPRFRGNTQRYLHPHAYDWPMEGSQRLRADLPIMNWQAATASEVTLQLERAWHVERTTANEITLRLSTHIVSVSPANRELRWQGASPGAKQYDTIVFAIGVGTEERRSGTPTYWENDSLGQVVFGGPREILISGMGDGALVDLARASLHQFDHAHFVLQLVQDWKEDESRRLHRELLGIEAAASAAGYDLDRAYSVLDLRRVEEHVVGNLRRDRVITLNVAGLPRLQTNTMILNRVIYESLRRTGLKVWEGRLKNAEPIRNEIYAELETGEIRKFDAAVLRHGPRSDLEHGFSSIATALRTKSRSNDDATKVPVWMDGYFADRRYWKRATGRPRRFVAIEVDVGLGLQSRAWSVNEAGAVVGWTYLNTSPDYVFFVWGGSGLPPEVGHIPGAGQMAAIDINATGDYIVTTQGGGGQAWLISNGTLASLPSIGVRAMPYSLNSARLVVGYSDNENGIECPCSWKEGKCHLLADRGLGGTALRVNEDGAIVGEVRINKQGHLAAARWSNNGAEFFEPPEGYYAARAFGLNQRGDAAGYVMGNRRSSQFFVWPNGGKAEIIAQGEAYAVNDAGSVVGRSGQRGAFLYADGNMHWFDDMVDGGWKVDWPRSITNDFRIASNGRKRGVSRALLLIPRND